MSITRGAGITAGRAVLVALLVAAVLFPALSHIALAGSYNKFKLETEKRYVKLTGYIEFNNALKNGKGYIETSNMRIEVNPGDHVKIVLNTNIGSIKIGQSHVTRLCIKKTYVDRIEVNDEVVAKNVQIKYTKNIFINASELRSTLTLEVKQTPTGETVLKVNNKKIIDSDNDNSHILIRNIHPGKSAGIEIELKGNQHMVDEAKGLAYEIYVNGAEAPIWTPLSILGTLAAAIVIIVASPFYNRPVE